MKDRTKIMHNIVSNILEIIPRADNDLNIIIEDYESKQILEVAIKLKIRELEKESD